jgi:copper chaperone CopZ
MTCSNCAAKIKSELLKLPGIESSDVSLEKKEVVITMSKHIALSVLQNAVLKAGNYVITEKGNHSMEMKSGSRSWIITYKPILIIFAYIILVSSVIVFVYDLTVRDWMNFFMAQFFIVFSFFKLLDLKGFAEGYSTYDLLAKKWSLYGFIYPFIELIFGIWLLTNFNLSFCYVFVALVMSFSLLGVINSLRKKQIIECACLGTIFKIPLGTVTLVEDAMMVLMSVASLIWH